MVRPFAGEIQASPILAPGSVVIVAIGYNIGTGNGQIAKRLLALDRSTGQIRWVAAGISGSFYATPALSSEGILYVASEANRVYLDARTASLGYLILSYPEAKGVQGVSCEIQTSASLPPIWTPLAPGVAEGEPEDRGTCELKRVRIPISSPGQSVFVRVAISIHTP